MFAKFLVAGVIFNQHPMNEDMYTNDISNRMLYDLIMDMKQEMDRRFEAVDRRFESMDRKFESLEAKFDNNTARLEVKIDRNTELINELYRRGDKVELSFSRKVLLGNGLFAGVISFFVALFTGRMIVEA